MKRKRVPDKKNTYYDKYIALQNDFLEIPDLQVLEELSYNKARLKMKELISLIIMHNEDNPNNKWRYNDEKPYKVPKEFVINHFGIKENYIFKKAKEEIQLNNLLSKVKE